jgi:hypothetical protein
MNLRICSNNQLKRRVTVHASDRPQSTSQYLLFSAEANSHPLFVLPTFICSLCAQDPAHQGDVTTILTDLIRVVKARTSLRRPALECPFDFVFTGCTLQACSAQDFRLGKAVLPDIACAGRREQLRAVIHCVRVDVELGVRRRVERMDYGR